MCLAVPGQLISIEEGGPADGAAGDAALWRMGRVSFGGIVKEVSLAYVPEATVGDYVIVHVGFALSIVDQDAAAQTLTDLDQLQLEWR